MAMKIVLLWIRSLFVIIQNKVYDETLVFFKQTSESSNPDALSRMNSLFFVKPILY